MPITVAKGMMDCADGQSGLFRRPPRPPQSWNGGSAGITLKEYGGVVTKGKENKSKIGKPTDSTPPVLEGDTKLCTKRVIFFQPDAGHLFFSCCCCFF